MGLDPDPISGPLFWTPFLVAPSRARALPRERARGRACAHAREATVLWYLS